MSLQKPTEHSSSQGLAWFLTEEHVWYNGEQRSLVWVGYMGGPVQEPRQVAP